MLKNKILIKITGSIAAYKCAYLISKLVQSNFEVKTVVTQSALHFIGSATLEGLTHSPVYSDTFASGKMMSHIELTKWADLTIVIPADANTINKFANGIADNLVTSLFLAQDFSKPYLIAPAMNTNMFNHPATQKSFKTLENWGVKVLPTDTGHLACGDEGVGKLLEPDKIFDAIINKLAKHNPARKKILITGGGTKENIDGVRYIANLSTGKTSAVIADYLFEYGNDVTLLLAENSIAPVHQIKISKFKSFKILKDELKSLLSNNYYDAVIHLAAVSDYSPKSIKINGAETEISEDGKISSEYNEFEIKFVKNEKLVNSIKQWSKNPKIKLFAFKFTAADEPENKRAELNRLFSNADVDFIVYNSLHKRTGNVQKNFEIIEPKGKSIYAETSVKLSGQLNKIITEN